MTAPDQPLSREERLAAKLRENLRRRKTQARAITAQDTATAAPAPTLATQPGEKTAGEA